MIKSVSESRNLKSSLDRFIVMNKYLYSSDKIHLKSSLDRFIDGTPISKNILDVI